MDDVVTLEKRRGPAPGILKAEPLYPGKVLEIVRLHEDEGLSFREVAARVGGSGMNCCALYNRWSSWAWAARRRSVA